MTRTLTKLIAAEDIFKRAITTPFDILLVFVRMAFVRFWTNYLEALISVCLYIDDVSYSKAKHI